MDGRGDNDERVEVNNALQRISRAVVLALAVATSACVGALQGGTIGGGNGNPLPLPGAAVAFDLVGCRSAVADNYCDGAASARFTIAQVVQSGTPDPARLQVGDGNGYVFVSAIPSTWGVVTIRIEANGFDAFQTTAQTADLIATNAKGLHNFYPLKSSHVDPSSIPLEQLAAIRGAMWPLGTASTCGPVSLGPRPGQADNVIATDFITDYPENEQACIIAELKARGYTHVVMGPLVDSDGYHGIWQPNDWRGANFDRFLDAVQRFYDNGLAVVVFISPDGWSLEQNQAEFTALLSTPRAQRLIRIAVPHGWEPARYGTSSCTWALWGQWIRQTLPNALVAIHTESDVDAPVGTDARCNDDDHAWNPGGNAAGWGRVAPFFHLWLTQSGAFANPDGTGGDREHPELTNFQNWARQFDQSVRGSYRDRFEHGYAGWPRASAWSDGRPLRVGCGEYSAYWKFWQHRTEAEGETWGNACIAAGGYFYLDSGRVAVPVQ